MKLQDLGKGIYHVTDTLQFNLAHAFLRVQESYSNDLWWGNRRFTEQEFMQWYDGIRLAKKDRWEYHREYVGFSVPSYAFRPFYKGEFNPISSLEDKLLKLLAKPIDKGNKRGFVIGSLEGDFCTMDHELSCALDHVDPHYKYQSVLIVQTIPKRLKAKMDAWFRNDGNYFPGFWDREIAAEFVDWDDSYMMKEAGLDKRTKQMRDLHARFRALFNEHSQKR